ncbi:hypothetical protein Tco_1264650 [Tanacetum coccineum]
MLCTVFSAIREVVNIVKKTLELGARGVECGDPNHLIGEYSKPPKNNDQRAFVGGYWSDSDEDEEEKIKDEKCLVAKASNKNPKTSHLEAVERIFRYVTGTTHLGLWYPKGSGIETIVYADSDHAGYSRIARALWSFALL